MKDAQQVERPSSNDLVTFEAASQRPELFPEGKTVSSFSLRRWNAEGLGKPRIKLPATRIGGRYYVRPSDITEFLAAVADPELYRRRKTTERCETAKRRLQRAGA